MLKVLDILAVTVLGSIARLLQILPWGAALCLARWCVGLVCFFMPRFTRTGRRNLELVFPEKSPEEREKILKSSFSMLAKNLVGLAKLPCLTKDNVSDFCDMSRAVELVGKAQARNPEVGTLFLIPHFGPFELFGQLWALAYRPYSTIARGSDLPRLDRWWTARREMHGVQVLGREGGYQEIVRRLRSGRDFTLLFDQNIKRNHAVFVDLFGIKAATTKTMALTALRTHCLVFHAVMAEKGPWKYELIVDPIEYNTVDGSLDDQIERFTRRVHECLEKAVRQYPDHWFWIHRRFKTRPRGEMENLYK